VIPLRASASRQARLIAGRKQMQLSGVVDFEHLRSAIADDLGEAGPRLAVSSLQRAVHVCLRAVSLPEIMLTRTSLLDCRHRLSRSGQPRQCGDVALAAVDERCSPHCAEEVM